MKILLSWLKDYLDINLELDELAQSLTQLGLEVNSVQVIGLPMPENTKEFNISGLTWERDKFVVAEIREVMPHPNADRLVLCKLFDGTQELIVLTGAPNLFEYKGIGPLSTPIKVAYAREGARLYDGHQPGLVLTTLKKAVIRGVESFSMVCSEKELGISEEHEGIIKLDADAPAGLPLADYMGDAVFDINILPNMIRDASVLGVAMELSAFTGKSLHQPQPVIKAGGPAITGQAAIEITDPSLNPRFVLGLVKGVKAQSSPYVVQRRLRLAGMRPINSIVDATNYIMLETGEPLHAFDYDVLVKRAKGKSPKIITRAARQGEKLTTLDEVEHTLDDFTILVCDTAGALSLAGVMGGMESEVTENTQNVLLEGAAWNVVNVRRTVTAQRLNSEAGYRFARGIHPALAETAVKLGLDKIASWSGGEIAAGLIDNYPQPFEDPTIEITAQEVENALGVKIPVEKISQILSSLGFEVKTRGDTVSAKSPATRTDIHTGLVGKADLYEEIARLFGFDNIPSARLSDLMPPIHPHARQENEEKLRDALVRLGLQEVITYRMTETSREAKLTPPGKQSQELKYVELKNPLTPERSVMRRSLLASVLEIAEKNSRISDHLALFEIAPVFIPREEDALPKELPMLAIVLTGKAGATGWDRKGSQNLDFFDLKGIVQGLFDMLHISDVKYTPLEETIFHPGKCARLTVGDELVGMMGELHPVVKERFDFSAGPVLAVEINLEQLLPLLPDRQETTGLSNFPPVLEDIAVVVDEAVTAEQLEAVIHQGGGKLVTRVDLFDIFRSEQIGAGKKSIAYSLTYQAPDRTLTDKDASQIRQKIIRRLEQELAAKLRS